MKAVVCTTYGPPEKLEIQELPSPEPKKGEVAVKGGAAALNFFDTLIIEGKYQIKPEPPFSPVSEFAGTVLKVGEGVTGFKEGDRVAGTLGYGAAQEEIAAKADQLARIPEGVKDEIAAGLFVTYGTTLHALKDRAKLKEGETLAVLGASGGVGIAAVELGKLMGAHVIACASSDEKLAFCKERGADETLNYSKDDLKDGLKNLTGGKGADVIYDPVGGKFSEAALRANAWDGRFLVIGFAAGDIPRIPLNLVLLKGNAIVGVFWGAWAARFPDANRANNEQIMQWVADGKLKPHLDRVVPLSETPAAIRALANREVMGKVVVTP